MITIKEIASRLGLSTTTVSNVIHGKTREVSAETIERVQRFLEEVEYVPNINARNLAQGQSKIIGVVLYISDDIAEILQHVSIWNVDGLILFCMMDDDADRVAAKYHKPVVCIDTYSSGHSGNFVNVGLDDEEDTYKAVRYLIENGHRRIAFLTDNSVGVDRARFWGYRKALAEAGIEYSDKDFFLLRPGEIKQGEYTEELCTRAHNYTAMFCCSDIYAALMMAELKDRGFEIPGDISVIGFDDNLYSRVCSPRLTTVHQNADEKGRVAAATLIRLVRGEMIETKEIRLKTHLVIRDTVRRIEAPDM